MKCEGSKIQKQKGKHTFSIEMQKTLKDAFSGQWNYG